MYTWLSKTVHKPSAHTPGLKELTRLSTKDSVEATSSDLVLMLLGFCHAGTCTQPKEEHLPSNPIQTHIYFHNLY